MPKTDAIAEQVIHPEALERILPSGQVVRLKPLTGDTYLKYQAKVVGFSLKGGGGISAPTQWLATQLFELVSDGEAKALDLATLTMTMDFDDAAAINAIANEYLNPPEAEVEGTLPSGASLERLKLAARDYWAYQDKVGAAIDRKTGQIRNGEGLVSANIALATKMFAVNGEPVTEAWLRAASFEDCALVMGEVGKRLAATQQP
jgi:hypothetical protein